MIVPRTFQVKVAARRSEALGVESFELVGIDTGFLPTFTAGAHIDVHVPNGPIRQYSLCNAPSERHRYLIAVQRELNSQGGSAGMHEKVEEGCLLTISEPRNLFPLSENATHHLLLAGGIGITPLIAMAEQLSAKDISFELHYCSRQPLRTAFMSRLAATPYSNYVQHYFDDMEKQQKLNICGLLEHAPNGSHLYVCGPKGFMELVLSTARKLYWKEEQLHYEYFGTSSNSNTLNKPFEVVIASTGHTLVVSETMTVVQALKQAGIDISTSCEQGICGTCLTSIIDGVPEHRDQYLTEEEQKGGQQFLPCCSRSITSRLVLDL